MRGRDVPKQDLDNKSLLWVMGGSPQLTTIGADKTLAIWSTISFKELRSIKPVPKLACHSVASWCHPRAPNLDILTCVKDCYIWAIEHPTYSALTRPLCELSSLAPPQLLASTKKLRVSAWLQLAPTLVNQFRYLAIVWPDIPYFRCTRLPVIHKPGSARKGKEAAASSATVQVHIILDDGTSNILTRSIDGRSEPVIGLQGGALLGVAFRTSRRINVVAATSISSVYAIVRLCFKVGKLFSLSVAFFPSQYGLHGTKLSNIVLLLTAIYCDMFAKRQLFVATPTTIGCAFVDAGVAPIDIETKRSIEEMRMTVCENERSTGQSCF
ncbi:hypothetical protein MKW98_026594 [Papaver atlanticum]|uniref:Uncharacterized protein n=1 Tax=Papaver atlanticum TaxID=357466 RepID=A0AAD4X6I3_9MAGN|nr:hypothetical protein MKW98_026594 [Papaver atlanticum]